MSEVIDVEFAEAEYDALLQEVVEHLPAFIHKGASEQHDPVGDVRELLNLEEKDLERVIAIHECLDEAVLDFAASLRDGLRRPITSSERPAEVSQAIRGPIDWSATTARRAFEAGNPSLFVVRPAQRIFDTPENRALVWLIGRLEAAVSTARISASDLDEAPEAEQGWAERIELLRTQLGAARRVTWLRGVRPEEPGPRTLKRLRAARRSFYAEKTRAAIETVLLLRNPPDETLIQVLAQRYFVPDRTWRLFEVAVALRLARAFADKSTAPRRTRLLVGAGRATYARYGFEDGSEVALIYQGWPAQSGQSLRSEAARRHHFRPGPSRPDLFIVRTGPGPDCAILELKATYSPGYLGSGLSQLLGYLAERPELWEKKPSGWLIAPGSATFTDERPAPDDDLWVVSAESVGDRALERFVA